MKNNNLIVRAWEDYELLDSGDNKKLERFGEYILIRPETQALWRPADPAQWKRAHAEFIFNGGKGMWRGKKLPATWNISFKQAHLGLRPTAFKHIGIFPEQRLNWEWMSAQIQSQTLGQKNPNLLNLFGYTGVATILAAARNARVTHVDASEQSNKWAKENARLSGITNESTVIPARRPVGQTQAGTQNLDPRFYGGDKSGTIRFITEDALKFAEREARRGVLYDGIILDPPAFGRGAKKEVWRIEENLSVLLGILAKILSPRPGSFFLLNGYAAGYSPESLRQVVENFFPEIAANAEYGELQIAESKTERVVPSGIYVRFVR